MKDYKTLLSLTPVIERLEAEVKKLKKERDLYKKALEDCNKKRKELEIKKYSPIKFEPKVSYKKLQQELLKKNRGVNPAKLTYEDHYPSSLEYKTPDIIKKLKKELMKK